MPDCWGMNQSVMSIKMLGPNQAKICFENHHEQLKALYITYVDLSPSSVGSRVLTSSFPRVHIVESHHMALGTAE